MSESSKQETILSSRIRTGESRAQFSLFVTIQVYTFLRKFASGSFVDRLSRVRVLGNIGRVTLIERAEVLTMHNSPGGVVPGKGLISGGIKIAAITSLSVKFR